MSSVVPRHHTMEISSPVLRSSTSSQIHSNTGGYIHPESSSVQDNTNTVSSPRPQNCSSPQHINTVNSPSSHSCSSPQHINTVNSPSPQSFYSPQHTNTAHQKIFSSSPRSVPTPPSSEASSDIGRDVNSPPLGGHIPGFVIPLVEGITDDDINQVDMFYRSQMTQVHVCRSLTNMYLSAPKPHLDKSASQSPQPSDIAKHEWNFSQTGIPALVLDTGEHRRGRKLRLVLAEKGSGFTLWQDEVTPRTQYRMPHTNFHTFSISTDSTRLVGFSFDEAEAATKFAEIFQSLTASSEDDLLSAGKKKTKKKKEKKAKFKPPKKIDISQPCCFVHVTKLERPDLIGGMFPPPPNGVQLDHLGMARATSESSGLSDCSTNPSDY